MGQPDLGAIFATPLDRIALAEGDVLHAMKRSDRGFAGFGEAYFSIVNHGAVKAWKRHLRMTLNLVVPVGEVQFVFADGAGAFRAERIGEGRYRRLTVPPGVWFGFKGLAAPWSLLMNVADIAHDPLEVERRSISEMKFDWEQAA